MSARGRVLFVFLDGVGVGEDDPDRNPLARGEVLPTLQERVGGSLPTRARPNARGPNAVALGLDATLGIDGTPQSGTGQAALLTGRNAAEICGRHFGPWTPVRLRPLVEEESVLRRAQSADRTVAFANAYPRGWPGPDGGRRIAAPPLAARGAGVLTRHEEALGAGNAVSSEIVNDGWRRHLGHRNLPDVTPAEAGRSLARIAAKADLTLYAHYATDTAGHRQEMDPALSALERVDAFMAGLLDELDEDTTVVLTSDHGNIEDVTAGHTRNPALCFVAGSGAEAWAERLRAITDVAAAVLEHLDPKD